MRTTHKLNLTSVRAVWAASALIVLAGLVFAFAPMKPVAAARQALAARVNASPTAEKILSIAPAPVRTAIKKRIAPVASLVAANAATAPSAAAAMFAPYGVNLTANPIDGSTVGQGQTITYTINITNNGGTDVTAAGGFLRYSQNAPTNTVFSNPTVVTQPGGGSTAWSCVLGGGGNLACQAGDGTGAGVENFAAGATVTLRVTATVNNNTNAGAIITSAGTFEYQDDAVGPQNVIQNSNSTNHFVSLAVDLAISKFSQTAQPFQDAPQNGVLAGGNSVTLTSLGDVGNEGRGNISYVLNISNLSGQNAANTTIEDTVPAGPAQLVNAPPAPNAVAGLVPGPPATGNILDSNPAVTSISINGGGSATQFRFNCIGFGIGVTFTCTPADNTAINPTFGPGTLPAGFRGRIAYRLRMDTDAVAGNIVSNLARITTNGATDINGGNNTSLPAQNVIYTRVDLGIAKATTNNTPVNGGAAFAYTLTVRNENTPNGSSDARNVLVTDPLPAGILFQNVSVVNAPSVPGFGLTCTGPAVGTNGVVTCTGTLPGHNQNTGVTSQSVITIVVQAAANQASGVRTNTAQVTSSVQEFPGALNAAANSDSVQVNLQVNAPLSITKTGPTTVCAGDTITYQVTVNNGGNSTAINATIQDNLPANTTFLNLSGTGPFAAGCSHNGGTPGTVTCASVDIPSGLHTFNVTVKLAPNAPSGTLSNTATITTAGTGTIAVGTSTTNATVNHCSDLEITKADTPHAVKAGEDINYTITVKNVGPSDIGAGEFVVADPTFIPAGTTLKTGTVISAPGFTCNNTTTFPCTATAPLPAGASVQIKFTVTVNANFNGGQPGGFVVNTATVAIVAGTNAVDPNSQNNSSTATTPIGPSADLSVTKQSFTLAGSAFDAQVTAGGAISAAPPALPVPIVTGQGEIFYALTYRNSGLGDAVNVHVRDVIPANVQFVAGSIVVTPAAGPALTCTVSPLPTELDCTPTGGGTLPAGANGTISFRTRVLANVAENTAIKNIATINSEGIGATPATPDPNGGNNTSNTTQNRVRTEANLSITKNGPATAVAGTQYDYTLTVANNGVSDAQNVVVTDQLNAALDFVSASVTPNPNNWTCSPATDANGRITVTCSTATLIANDPNIIPPRSGSNTATITIRVRVKPQTPAQTAITNTATVAAGTSDPVAANNTSNTTTTNVATESAVAVLKSDNPDPVVAGTNLTYTLTVSNGGPSDAINASVTDTLPAGTTFLSATGTGIFAGAGVCVFTQPSTVTCTPQGGVIPAGVQAANSTITITVKVNPNVQQAPAPSNGLPNNDKTAPCTNVPGVLCNSATVNWQDSNGAVAPPTSTNNSNTNVERTNVRHESDMAIKKEAPDFAIAGSRFDYRLIISNKGPSDVLGDATQGSIMVTDLLPEGTSLANFTPNPFIAPGGPGNFTCYSQTGQGPNNNQTRIICLNSEGAAGNFFAGANLEIIIKVDTQSSLAEGTNLYNCAQVTLRDTNPTPELDPLGGGQHNDGNTGVRPNVPVVFPTITTAASGNNESCDGTVVRTLADLAIGKSAVPVVDPDGAGPLTPVPLPVVGPNVPPGSVNAGGYIRYDVPFGNNGPSDALNTLITDQIAGNTAFVGALATGGVFVPAAQPPAVPFNFTIQAVDTVAPIGGPINLTCTVWQAAGTQSIYCRPQGNTNVANPNVPQVPATVNFADGTLPAGYNGTLTFFVKVNESVSGGTIVSNPANITSGLCPNPAPNQFPPSACASTADPNTSNNTTLPTQTVVVASSNLTVSKVVQSAVTAASNPNQTGPIGPATAPNGTATTGTAVLPGTYLTYRITLTNNGPSDVSNIRLTDVLPSGLETPPGRVLGAKYVSISPVIPSGATFTCSQPQGVSQQNNPQQNGGSVVCTAPLLAANAPNNTAAIDVTVFIDPATKANLVDVATFDATINNFNRPVSGSTTLTTPVAPTSDLALTKTHTNAAGVVGGPVTAGTTFQYTITATNNGPSTAQMFNLVDTFPPFQRVTNIEIGRLDGNGQFVTPNAKDGNGNPNVTCNATPAVGAPGNTTSMTCTASELPPNKNPDNTVNPAGTVVFRLTVVQDPFTIQPTPTQYQNCVTATSMSTDPVAANSTNVCDTVPIIFSADLSGTKTDTPDPVIAGNNLTYVITANNAGPSAAFNLSITDQLPTGTVFVSAVASPGATLVTPAVNANGTVVATWDAAGGTANGLTGPGVVRTLTIVVRVCPDFQQIRNLSDAEMCVPNLNNRGVIASQTPDPNPANNNADSVTTVQAQSDLSISKSVSPNPVQYSTTGGPSNVTYTITFANAGPSNANGVTITDVLPKGFTVAPGANSLTSTVPGTTFTTTTDGNGITTVVANLGVIGAANQCQLTRPTSGTVTIVARVPIKHPTITVTNTATIASTNCLPETGTLAVQTNPLSGNPAIITPGTLMLANNRAFADLRVVPPQTTPGVAYPALSEVSDQKEGSILFYPIYTSDAVNANLQNTRIAMTNTSNTEKVTIHLFAVDGASCAVLDAFVCLTPNQTTVFLASDFDPGNTGYLMAVAVDDSTGIPRAFNELIGDEYVKFQSGHQANLGAEAIAASMLFPAGPNPNVSTATLRFDGMNYNRLPRILASDNIPSPADGNSTMMIINRVGGNFTTTGATIGNFTGQLFDDQEQAFSFTANQVVCQYRKILDNTFPRTFTPFTRVLPAGRSGWMKFYTVEDRALFGAQINFNANAGTNAGAFNQGHNLHKLTLTDAATLVIPVFIPSC
ncbi:MAG TPA: isopeptide-forming domain-containing fimbrial protein [Blastocatellia bacterium]|nr:isopeptide-forming domain-containing fimbrial protein [Blastocatellia bacterium]HNG30640.1 isopeptide-forming domain-containing fimbrial protein [Blastocatellia bacterium]